ncbi:MAG: hypothetical protein HN389_12755 [Clostridia bacterium]|jgi:hypothetical protein|nr:hypothetical protein [Clostridia bacterium]
MYEKENKSKYDKTLIIEFEVERLSRKYNKEFLDCKDLMDILGVGRDNVRKLMRSEGFPTISIGNRKVVPIMSFVIWQQDSLTLSRL